MKKRSFLKTSGLLVAGALIAPQYACKTDSSSPSNTSSGKASSPYTLPELGFELDALAPKIDAETMGLHHGKHHAGYVRKFNKALEGHEWAQADISTILKNVTMEDEHTAIRNNGGGHYNHTLFWEVLKPGGGTSPSGDLGTAMRSSFSNLDDFTNSFMNTAKSVFGSGWAWLCTDESGNLFISATENQDNPLMSKIVDKPGTPILGIDVWEHAYYLNYQNRRGDYVENFMELINWEAVNQRYTAALL